MAAVKEAPLHYSPFPTLYYIPCFLEWQEIFKVLIMFVSYRYKVWAWCRGCHKELAWCVSACVCDLAGCPTAQGLSFLPPFRAEALGHLALKGKQEKDGASKQVLEKGSGEIKGTHRRYFEPFNGNINWLLNNSCHSHSEGSLYSKLFHSISYSIYILHHCWLHTLTQRFLKRWMSTYTKSHLQAECSVPLRSAQCIYKKQTSAYKGERKVCYLYGFAIISWYIQSHTHNQTIVNLKWTAM